MEESREAILRTSTPLGAGRVRAAISISSQSKKKILKQPKDKLSRKERRLAKHRRKASNSPPLPKILQDLQAIVVNLDRRHDRLAACAEKIKCHCPWLHYTRFRASDGRADTIPESEVTRSWNTAKNVVYQKRRAIRKGWDDLESYVVRDLEHSAGERGCSSSHIRAWRHCIEQSRDAEKPLLVLEDDAAPTEEFTRTLRRALAKLPANAHVLYLGYSQATEWRREISPELVEADYVWTTVGYIIWPEGARILLNRLPIDQPVDNWMATACAEGNLNSYCVRPKIVLQAEAWNVNSDVGHSDEMYWGPNGDIQHSDAFYWGFDETEQLKLAVPNNFAHRGNMSMLPGRDDFSSDEDNDDDDFDEEVSM